ncbi:TPA: type IV conjugative transfer system coupling protein TraD, partial [Escherichia coli]
MASINTIVKRKQYLWLGIVVVGAASAIGGALYLSDVDMSGNGEAVAEQEPVPDMTGVVDTTFDDKVRQHATTEMQVTAAQMQKQYEEIRRELDVLNKQRGDDQRRIEKLGQDNAALAEQVKALGANPVTATGEPVPQMPASPPGPEGEPQPGNTPVSFPPQGSVAVPPPTAFYPGNGVTPPPQVTYQSVPVPNRIQRKVFIRIGDLPIIRDSEIKNFCLHGTVGAGKSEVIRRLANYARKRGDMVVIYDRSCEFVKSYYDPSIDKILNPLDARCAAWDLWKECLTQPDFDNVANTLIPMGTKEDPFWQGSGRTIFAEAAFLMRNDPNRSYSKLVDTLLSIKIEKLRTFLRNSPAANLVEEKIEKTAISIRAVLTNYVKAIRYLQGIEHNGEPFTIRDWMRGVREDKKNGWLFISSNADTHASLKPVVSMWLSIAIRGLMAMGENRNRRVWFFCDELPTLHKLPDLVEILPEARKFGGCYVFGIQSYAQLEDIYGEKSAASLFDVMNTRAFFRSPSHKIAEFAAGEIGEKEHLKASEQYSYGADPVRDGVSTGKDMERQTLVSYSDIQSLPDLTCYVTLPGPYPAVKLSLKYQERPKVAPEFIPREINPEMENRLSAVLAAREAEGRQMASLFEPDVPEVVSGEDVVQA